MSMTDNAAFTWFCALRPLETHAFAGSSLIGIENLDGLKGIDQEKVSAVTPSVRQAHTEGTAYLASLIGVGSVVRDEVGLNAMNNHEGLRLKRHFTANRRSFSSRRHTLQRPVSNQSSSLHKTVTNTVSESACGHRLNSV